MNKQSIRKKLLRLRKNKYPKNLSLNPIKVYKFLHNKVLGQKLLEGIIHLILN